MATTFAISLSSADLYFRAYGPRGSLLVKNTDLTWECWADDSKSITGYEASLNGKKIDAIYDAQSRKLIANTGKLEPGSYAAELVVKYGSGSAHRKAWQIQVRPDALDELPPPDPNQRQALSTANDLRKKMGLGEYTMDDRVNAASMAHASYLNLNNTTGHAQEPGKPGFVGRTHRERLEAFGFVGTAAENISFGAGSSAESIKGLIDAPYHRLPFLAPGQLRFGCGQVGKVLAMATTTPEANATVVFPFDGQTGVARSWSKPERPDPLAIHGASGRTVGYPITAVFFTEKQSEVRIEEAVLEGPRGPVVCLINTPANDKNLTNAVFLIPKDPLLSGATYQVKVKATVIQADGTRSVEKSWSFVTER